jgi:hypothetical protein
MQPTGGDGSLLSGVLLGNCRLPLHWQHACNPPTFPARRPAIPAPANDQLKMVDHVSAPLCLKLAHGTRVCGLRVDTAADIHFKVRDG